MLERKHSECANALGEDACRGGVIEGHLNIVRAGETALLHQLNASVREAVQECVPAAITHHGSFPHTGDTQNVVTHHNREQHWVVLAETTKAQCPKVIADRKGGSLTRLCRIGAAPLPRSSPECRTRFVPSTRRHATSHTTSLCTQLLPLDIALKSTPSVQKAAWRCVLE